MAFDKIVETNCQTGETVTRDPTKDEVAQWKRDAKDQAEREKLEKKDRAAMVAKRASIVDALAALTDFTPDELRDALNAP